MRAPTMQTVPVRMYGDYLTFGSLLSRLSSRYLGSLFLTGRGVGRRHRGPFRGLAHAPLLRGAPVGERASVHMCVGGIHPLAHAGALIHRSAWKVEPGLSRLGAALQTVAPTS